VIVSVCIPGITQEVEVCIVGCRRRSFKRDLLRLQDRQRLLTFSNSGYVVKALLSSCHLIHLHLIICKMCEENDCSDTRNQ
jgi:hypothetical protein